jgi:hypothetical protein
MVLSFSIFVNNREKGKHTPYYENNTTEHSKHPHNIATIN